MCEKRQEGLGKRASTRFHLMLFIYDVYNKGGLILLRSLLVYRAGSASRWNIVGTLFWNAGRINSVFKKRNSSPTSSFLCLGNIPNVSVDSSTTWQCLLQASKSCINVRVTYFVAMTMRHNSITVQKHVATLTTKIYMETSPQAGNREATDKAPIFMLLRDHMKSHVITAIWHSRILFFALSDTFFSHYVILRSAACVYSAASHNFIPFV